MPVAKRDSLNRSVCRGTDPQHFSHHILDGLVAGLLTDDLTTRVYSEEDSSATAVAHPRQRLGSLPTGTAAGASLEFQDFGFAGCDPFAQQSFIGHARSLSPVPEDPTLRRDFCSPEPDPHLVHRALRAALSSESGLVNRSDALPSPTGNVEAVGDLLEGAEVVDVGLGALLLEHVAAAQRARP